MRSQWIRAGLTERDLETDTRRESSREDGGRGLEGRVYKPGALGSHQPPDGPPDAGRGRKDPPPEPSEGAGLASAWVSDSSLQAVRECVCCFKPPFW